MPRPTQDLERLWSFAAAQGGVVSQANLMACGFSSGAVRRRIAEGSWHRIGAAVALGPERSGPPAWSDIALSWILRWTFGTRARISGALALRRAHWHLPCEAHIVVLAEKPRARLPGVVVLRRPEAETSGTAGDIRFVSAREALVDCLTVLPAATAADLLDAALQKRYVRPQTLAEDLEARLGRGRRNAAGLRSLRDRAMSGSRSEAEQRMARVLRRSATGPWMPNYALRDGSGRVIAEIDFAHVGLRIAIEVDGRAFHSDRRSFERDRWRQNALVVGGWLILRFTWEQITERPDEVIGIICAAVAQRAA
ncbi:MAG: hypothetical protein RL134_446 [Actinomycetota bacterium]